MAAEPRISQMTAREMIYAALRFPAVVLGVFLVFTSTADIAGVVPYSNEAPPLIERISHSLFPLSFGACLVFPYKRIDKKRMLFGLILASCSAFYSWLWIEGIFEYMKGTKHIAIVNTAIVMLVVTSGNLLVFCLMKKRTDQGGVINSESLRSST